MVRPVSAILERLRILGYRYSHILRLDKCPQLLIASQADSHGADLEGFLEKGHREEEKKRRKRRENKIGLCPCPCTGPPGTCSL